MSNKIKIRWRYPVEFQVVTDEVNGVRLFEKKNWRPDDEENVTILDDRDGFVDIQFGDGNVAYHVDRTLFKCMKANNES